MRREKRQQRIVMMILFFFLAVATLGGRIFFLQFIRGGQYAAKAVAQRTGAYVYESGRGQILDNSGMPLHASWEEVAVTFAMEQPASSQNFIEVNRDPAKVRGQEGLTVQEEIRYHENSIASHVTGYIEKPRNPLQPRNGISGLERVFNDELYGTPSAVGGVLDAHGQLVAGLGVRKWKYNHLTRPFNVRTTIDRLLQSVVEKVGGEAIRKGAAVILDPQNGDILALASFPRLPVEHYYNGISAELAEKINIDEPHFNRALAQYAPGSVFKVFLTAAALEVNLPEPDGQFLCTGSYQVGNRIIRCYEDKAHGVVDLHEALAVSCNGYFVNLAERLGKTEFLEMARRFRLGRATNIPLGSEAAGRIPDSAEIPYPGDVANAAIGQGQVAVTPLQLARAMAIIVNKGRDIYPRLVTEVIDKNGNTVKRYPVQYGATIVDPTVTHRLKPMLEDVVESGTAQGAYSTRYQAAGKSGTAETGRSGISHSWFAGYITIEGRTLVSVVFIEEWKKGDPVASTIFRRIFESLNQ